MSISGFIERWQASGGAERANFQLFATELTELLGLEKPKPVTPDGSADDYCFERPVRFFDTRTTGRIDLYRRHRFVMEGKQGAGGTTDPNQLSLLPDTPRTGHGQRGTRRWDDSMIRARAQADRYAREIARQDGWPPFLLVVDVGHVIEVYADFSGQGQGYAQFPDKSRYRITLDQLHDPEVQDRLRAIWNDPHSLDPARISARVTRQVAGHLAELGKSFEGQGHASETVARFLMRCLFAMFAEDVRLIPENAFRDLLTDLRGRPQDAQEMLTGLFREMDSGGMSHVLRKRIPRFNGGLFAGATALPLNEIQLHLLIQAAQCDWKAVEPAIFGTLLERALDTRQRHKLGAHYTPRAYVERLVTPVVMEPLRRDWQAVQTAALHLARQGKEDEAKSHVLDFHRTLCEVHVLDPACGSGNFLYVALELMKRLEGEVFDLLAELGHRQQVMHITRDGRATYTVSPRQFLGLEVNPWAAAVAELVLWIGHLQWHFRTHGTASPADPVLEDFHNIENRDAVLAWDDRRPRLDGNGHPVTRWDGITTLPHPVTGEPVPDPAARVQVWDYVKPRPATWPEADFIVGNPPFIGASRMRDALGDGYTEAIRKAYPRVPDSADFVMFWWERAALAARAHKDGRGCRRFGLITTNSLRQTFNRKVLDTHLNDPKTPLGLVFAIPDHPWVDSGDGAAVRIAMTVAEKGRITGRLLTVTAEERTAEGAEGRDVTLAEVQGTIQPDLRVGADVAGAKALRANEGLAYRGMQLIGAGFIVTRDEARALGLGTVAGLDAHIRDYRNGRDLTTAPRDVMVIDLFGLTEAEVRTRFPAVYQWVLDKVKPERDQNNRDSYRRNWWIHGEPRKDMRPTLTGLPRYIATVETTKHRLFQFLPASTLPDNMLIAIALDDAAWLAILSSRIHVAWALTAGGRLGYGNDPRYNKSRCFDPFPFPTPTEAQKTTLRALGEELDAHRKDRQRAHPKLTLTAMYNTLEKLRAGERIEGRDREIYDQGLIGILKDIHDRIDTAVAAAYGWPADLGGDAILDRLVALNRERAEEESQGLIRWLRPDYQNPTGQRSGATGTQGDLGIAPADTATRTPWPKSLPDQVRVVREVLMDMGEATPDQIARRFARVQGRSIQPLLDTLCAMQFATAIDGGRYVG